MFVEINEKQFPVKILIKHKIFNEIGVTPLRVYHRFFHRLIVQKWIKLKKQKTKNELFSINLNTQIQKLIFNKIILCRPKFN